MKILFTLSAFLICCFLGFPSLGFSQNVTTGVIIEQSQNKEFIQVKDSIYRVSNVWRDNGVEEPIRITRNYLDIGSVVQIFEVGRTTDYYQTEKIVLFTGLRKQEALAVLSSD